MSIMNVYQFKYFPNGGSVVLINSKIAKIFNFMSCLFQIMFVTSCPPCLFTYSLPFCITSLSHLVMKYLPPLLLVMSHVLHMCLLQGLTLSFVPCVLYHVFNH